jgi:hypothetical protein
LQWVWIFKYDYPPVTKTGPLFFLKNIFNKLQRACSLLILSGESFTETGNLIFDCIIDLIGLTSFAQQKIFEGQLQDAHSDEAVVFASVLFKGTTTGKLSDSSGKFSFSLSHWPSDTLEITCVGYQPYYFLLISLKTPYLLLLKWKEELLMKAFL